LLPTFYNVRASIGFIKALNLLDKRDKAYFLASLTGNLYTHQKQWFLIF